MTESSSVVLASRDVNCGFITAQLQMIHCNANVTRLEVEDFVCSGQVHHSTILPLLQSILLSTTRRRQLESIQFVDTLWSLEELAQWQSAKAAMMTSFKRQLPKDLLQKVTWKATVHASSSASGTDSVAQQAVRRALQYLEKDQQIFQVKMPGGPAISSGHPLELEVASAIDTERDAQTKSILRQALAGEEEENQRVVGQKSDRPDFNDSYSSFGTVSTAATSKSSSSSSRRRQASQSRRRHRQKRNKMSAPDYDWKMGAYTKGDTLLQ